MGNNTPKKKLDEEKIINSSDEEGKISKIEKKSSLQNYKNMSKIHYQSGKKFMNLKDFNMAIQEYTKAIMCFDKDSKYYTNRAFCYRNILELEKMITDSRVALALDKENAKAYNLLGIGLIESEKNKNVDFSKIEEGIKFIEFALKLTKDKTNDILFQNELEIRIKRSKKILFFKKKELRNLNVIKTKEFLKEISEENDEKLKEINNLIDLEEKNYDISEIPECFYCNINYEPLKHPLLTPDGITYEKYSLIEHFNKLGYFDPLTRRELDIMRVIENKNIVEAYNYFEEKNPWAFEYNEKKENIFEIKL